MIRNQFKGMVRYFDGNLRKVKTRLKVLNPADYDMGRRRMLEEVVPIEITASEAEVDFKIMKALHKLSEEVKLYSGLDKELEVYILPSSPNNGYIETFGGWSIRFCPIYDLMTMTSALVISVCIKVLKPE